MSDDTLLLVLFLTTSGAYLIYSVFFSPHAYLLKKSFELCKSKRYFEAINTLEQLLKILPYYIPAWFDRGLLFSATKQYTEAVNSYDIVLKYRGVFNYNFLSKVWYNKGLALYELENYHDSIANYDLAFQTLGFGFLPIGRSFFYRIWYHRGLALHKLDKYTEAIYNYDLASRQHLYPLWSKLDRCMFQFRSYEKILAKDNPSLRHKPDLCSIWKSKSFTLYKLERYEEAIHYLDLILQEISNYHCCFYYKARCYMRLGKIDMVLENLQQSLYISQDEYIERIKIDSAFDALRQDRQFKNLLKRFE